MGGEDVQPTLEILDAEAHRHLRLRPGLASRPHFVQLVPEDFASAAAVCPIFFVKNPEDGRFFAGALFGFKPGENLLADARQGTLPYVPLELRREGFFIAGENIAIDPASPRFGTGEGERLFDDDGEPAPALRQLQRLLGRFKAGVDESDRLVAALAGRSLIEPVDISLRFDDGETFDLRGLYTVGLDRLNALDDASVLELFRSGYLQLAYCVAQSLKQVPVLAERRNRMLASGA